MPSLEIWTPSAGLLLFWPSGVFYSTQTCNSACVQRSSEGVWISPLIDIPFDPCKCYIATALKALSWGPVTGIDDRRAQEIDAILQSSPFTVGLSVDRTRLMDSEEAWVYVVVNYAPNAFYHDVIDGRGVLTWPNTD